MYVFLRAMYGPLAAFLYGWGMLVINAAAYLAGHDLRDRRLAPNGTAPRSSFPRRSTALTGGLGAAQTCFAFQPPRRNVRPPTTATAE